MKPVNTLECGALICRGLISPAEIRKKNLGHLY